jgi:hypothetical protein
MMTGESSFPSLILRPGITSKKGYTIVERKDILPTVTLARKKKLSNPLATPLVSQIWLQARQ